MGKHAKPKNIHPLLPKVYREIIFDRGNRYVRKQTVSYLPLPFGLGLVKYPRVWTKTLGGAYGLTGLSIRKRYWALYDWADHADFDDRGDYILRNIRQKRNGAVRVK